jgi:hypothetical protein
MWHEWGEEEEEEKKNAYWLSVGMPDGKKPEGSSRLR